RTRGSCGCSRHGSKPRPDTSSLRGDDRRTTPRVSRVQRAGARGRIPSRSLRSRAFREGADMRGFPVLLAAWLTVVPLASAQEFRAGTARAKITPEERGWLGGYGHRNKPAEGLAADLWARALALEDGQKHRRVIVSADIHIVTRRLHREIAEAA